MKKVFIALLATVISFGFMTYQAEAIETSGSASLDIYSSYMWRGFEVHEDVAIQPSVGITYGGFGANLWSDYNTDTQEVTETDLTVNYAFSKDKFMFDVGYIFYALDGDETVAPDTQEFFVSVGYDIMLSPTITLYYDFDEFDGTFIVASIGHDVPVYEDIAASLGASLSYNSDSVGDYSALHNGEISVSSAIPVKDALSLTPILAYSFALSDDAEEALENADGDSNFFYGGVSAAISF